MTAILKKALGDGGAFIGDSHGEDNLYRVLSGLADGSFILRGAQSTPSAAVLDSFVTDKAIKLLALSLKMGTTGTAGTATVAVKVDTVSVATASVANTETDGTVGGGTLAAPVSIAAGALVELEVTAIPTGGANLVTTARLGGVSTE